MIFVDNGWINGVYRDAFGKKGAEIQEGIKGWRWKTGGFIKSGSVLWIISWTAHDEKLLEPESLNEMSHGSL